MRSQAASEYCVPGGAFVSAGHSWARIDPAGQVWTGLDDFARKALVSIDRVELPTPGTVVKRGEPLFTVRRGTESLKVPSPVSGEVTQTNKGLEDVPQLLVQSPYDRGWACLVRPSDLATDLAALRIGRPVVKWYQDEVERLRQQIATGGQAAGKWSDLERDFFGSGAAVVEHVTSTV